MKIRNMLVDKIFNVDIALKFAPPAPASSPFGLKIDTATC